MPELGRIAEKVRSKNAGPFWITVDVFCGSEAAYRAVRDGLGTAEVAALYGTQAQAMKRFDLPDLHVVKFSFPRHEVQGGIRDRDMHGASFAALLAEFEIAAPA